MFDTVRGSGAAESRCCARAVRRVVRIASHCVYGVSGTGRAGCMISGWHRRWVCEAHADMRETSREDGCRGAMGARGVSKADVRPAEPMCVYPDRDFSLDTQENCACSSRRSDRHVGIGADQLLPVFLLGSIAHITRRPRTEYRWNCVQRSRPGGRRGNFGPTFAVRILRALPRRLPCICRFRPRRIRPEWMASLVSKGGVSRGVVSSRALHCGGATCRCQSADNLEAHGI